MIKRGGGETERGPDKEGMEKSEKRGKWEG